MLPKQYEVKGKNFIVSASARGIGKGIVEVLASSGAQVLATAISNTYLEKFSKDMKEKGFPIETIVADATKVEDWEKTVNYALNKWDNIDGLINNFEHIGSLVLHFFSVSLQNLQHIQYQM